MFCWGKTCWELHIYYIRSLLPYLLSDFIVYCFSWDCILRCHFLFNIACSDSWYSSSPCIFSHSNKPGPNICLDRAGVRPWNSEDIVVQQILYCDSSWCPVPKRAVIVPSKQWEITQVPFTVVLLLKRHFKLAVVRVLRYVMSKSTSMDPDRIAHHCLGDLPDNNFLSTDYKHIKIDVMHLCHSQQFCAQYASPGVEKGSGNNCRQGEVETVVPFCSSGDSACQDQDHAASP